MRTIPLEEFIHVSRVLVTLRRQISLMLWMAWAFLSVFASNRTDPSLLLTHEKSDFKDLLSSVQIWRLLGGLLVSPIVCRLRTWNLVHVSLSGPTRSDMSGCAYGAFGFLRFLFSLLEEVLDDGGGAFS